MRGSEHAERQQEHGEHQEPRGEGEIHHFAVPPECVGHDDVRDNVPEWSDAGQEEELPALRLRPSPSTEAAHARDGDARCGGGRVRLEVAGRDADLAACIFTEFIYFTNI